MIYTSYFAKLKQLKQFPNIIPVSICAKAPAWYDGYQYKKLAPKYGFFMAYKENHDEDMYTKCFYKQVLANISPQMILSDIQQLIQDKNKDICLLCYEKPEDFCHRHIVADWLQEHGIPCQEFQGILLEKDAQEQLISPSKDEDILER